jgi:hypothetical protein
MPRSENTKRKTSAERVKKHRNALRASGLRPIQIWVPDTRSKLFKQECLKQSRLVQCDPNEKETLDWIESTYDDEGWE